MEKGIRFHLVIVTCLAAAASLPAQSPESLPARFQQAGEIVARWSADQHLWINGNLPVAESHLAALEEWLDQNAPNWTIILMQNARGQSYLQYRGMAAVEHALGKQLANRTGFGKLTDSRTGEANGAFFILFLEERKFSYYASEAFDKRRLGENRWVGHLDRPAIAAMRGGRRIVDAVKDTVTRIEDQLTRKIDAESQARRRAAIARQQAIEAARQLAGELSVEIERIERTVSAIRERHPAARGDIVTIPLADWRAAVKAVDEFAKGEDAESARNLADRVRGEIEAHDEGRIRWQEDRTELDRLGKRLEEIDAPPEVPSVLGHLGRAEAALDSARENHAAAESLYREQIDVCDRALDQAENEIAAWRAALLAEQRRLEARRKTFRLASAVGAVLFVIFLIVANRLRRPVKEEAEEMLRHWRAKLRGKFDRLFQVMDEALVLVGPSSQLEERGFDGETLALSRKTIRQVDELFIMSSATDTVIEQAEKLIDPLSPGGWLVNAFSSHRYRTALSLLGSRPIGFDREQGLEAILDPGPESGAAGRSLLGSPEDYEPFRMSFEKLISAYDRKQAEAVDNLERLERGIDGLPLLLAELNVRHRDLGASAAGLSEAATEDGLFPVRSLVDDLLPAAAGNLEDAMENGSADPVSAMEGPALEAERRLEAAARLTALLENVRSRDFRIVESAAAKLEERGRKIFWIDDHYRLHSNRAEQLSKMAMDRSVEEELEEFRVALLRTLGRVSRCNTLAEAIENGVPAAIEKTAHAATSVREELAGKLNLSPESVLEEDDLSPFRKLEEARKALDAAGLALDRGNVAAAEEDLAEIEEALDAAEALLTLSRSAAADWRENVDSLTRSIGEITGLVDRVTGQLDEMLDDYDPAVLLISSRMGRPVKGQDSIRDGIKRARQRLQSAETVLEESEACFSRGKLIAAASLLERVGNESGFARHQLSLVEEQHDALKRIEAQLPGQLDELRDRCSDLAGRVNEPRTTRTTLEHFREIEESLNALAADLSEDRPNPFASALALEKIRGELGAVEQGIEADREAFASAEAAVSDTRRKLADSRRLIFEAHGDRIADSRKLTAAIHKHDDLAESVSQLERELEAPHGDWAAIRESSLEIIDDILENRDVMRSELDAARGAAEELRRASAALTEIQNWRSRHGVRVDRLTGQARFAEAREALLGGDYARARRIAGAARGGVLLELKRARSKERREERAEEERRRQQSSFSSGSGFGSGIGSSGSSFGGFSSGGGSSGVSRSSFSSGSGVSRSGW